MPLKTTALQKKLTTIREKSTYSGALTKITSRDDILLHVQKLKSFKTRTAKLEEAKRRLQEKQLEVPKTLLQYSQWVHRAKTQTKTRKLKLGAFKKTAAVRSAAKCWIATFFDVPPGESSYEAAITSIAANLTVYAGARDASKSPKLGEPSFAEFSGGRKVSPLDKAQITRALSLRVKKVTVQTPQEDWNCNAEARQFLESPKPKGIYSLTKCLQLHELVPGRGFPGGALTVPGYIAYAITRCPVMVRLCQYLKTPSFSQLTRAYQFKLGLESCLTLELCAKNSSSEFTSRNANLLAPMLSPGLNESLTNLKREADAYEKKKYKSAEERVKILDLMKEVQKQAGAILQVGEFVAKNFVDLSGALSPGCASVLECSTTSEIQAHLPFGVGTNTSFVLEPVREAHNKSNNEILADVAKAHGRQARACGTRVLPPRFVQLCLCKVATVFKCFSTRKTKRCRRLRAVTHLQPRVIQNWLKTISVD